MKRGRPVGSPIRQNIVEMLFFLKSSTGYDLYKAYAKIFPACTQRSIYYHLRKGVATGEFCVRKVASESGNYSWGNVSEKIYYELGPNAHPAILKNLESQLRAKQ